MPLPQPFRLLRTATAVSNLGDGVRLTALPLLATTITRDPRLIAGVAIADRLPWLVFILPGGAWADRTDRRLLRRRLDLVRAAVMATFVALVLGHRVSIVAVYVVTAVIASAEAVVDSSSMALVPSLVIEADLERAGGQLGSVELAANGLVGPPLGGLLLGFALAAPFVVDAASFALAAVIVGFIRGDHRPERPPSPSSMRIDIADGVRWLWRHRQLRNLALLSMLLGLVAFVGDAVFVLFARQMLHVSGAGYGLLFVPSALAGIAGSVLAARLVNLDLRAVLGVATGIVGAATLLLAHVSSAVVAAVLLAVSTAGVVVWNVLTLALRQRLIPGPLLGRVGASYRFLVLLAMPLGAVLGGVIAERFGVVAALTVAGVAMVLIAGVVPLVIATPPDPTGDLAS